MRIYYLVSDGGDGSASVRFYQNEQKARALVEGDDYEIYVMNEGELHYFEVVGGITHISFSDDEADI